MLLSELPLTSLGLVDLSLWQDPLSLWGAQLLELSHFLAQRIDDPDIIGKFQKSWKNFIESGQVWALGLGFVLGYLFRHFTAY